MKRLWTQIGRLAFFTLYPALWLYLYKSRRPRAIIISGSKIVLVKGWLDPGKWDLPGGGVHRGETTLHAVSREVKEEVGLDIEEGRFNLVKADAECRVYGFRVVYSLFVVQLTEMPGLTPQRFELLDAKWVDLKEGVELLPVPLAELVSKYAHA